MTRPLSDAVRKQWLAEIDAVLDRFANLPSPRHAGDRAGFVDAEEAGLLVTAMLSVVHRIAGPDSIYEWQVRGIARGSTPPLDEVRFLAGVVRTLRHDVASDNLGFEESASHGLILSDLLNMAQRQLDTGHKEAAGVLTRAVLELHLRNLCLRHRPDLAFATGTDFSTVPPDRLNSALAAAGKYTNRTKDETAVAAWLNRLNDAVEQRPEAYAAAQVRAFIDGVRGFLDRNPA